MTEIPLVTIKDQQTHELGSDAELYEGQEPLLLDYYPSNVPRLTNDQLRAIENTIAAGGKVEEVLAGYNINPETIHKDALVVELTDDDGEAKLVAINCNPADFGTVILNTQLNALVPVVNEQALPDLSVNNEPGVGVAEDIVLPDLVAPYTLESDIPIVDLPNLAADQGNTTEEPTMLPPLGGEYNLLTGEKRQQPLDEGPEAAPASNESAAEGSNQLNLEQMTARMRDIAEGLTRPVQGYSELSYNRGSIDEFISKMTGVTTSATDIEHATADARRAIINEHQYVEEMTNRIKLLINEADNVGAELGAQANGGKDPNVNMLQHVRRVATEVQNLVGDSGAYGQVDGMYRLSSGDIDMLRERMTGFGDLYKQYCHERGQIDKQLEEIKRILIG